MCRRPYRNVGLQPAFWTTADCPFSIRSKLLLLIGLLCFSLNLGCMGSGGGKRTLVGNPFRARRSDSSSTSTVQVSKTSQRPATDTNDDKLSDERSDIRLVGDQQAPSEEGYSPQVAALPSSITIDSDSVEVAIPTTGVTLADLEAIALAKNPTLLQSQAAISAEQGIYRQAGLYPNPQVGYFNASASSPGVKSSNGMFVSQEFVTANKLGLAERSATEEIKRYQWDNESQRKRVLNDLRIRYYEVLGAQESMAVANEMVEIAQKGLDLAEGNFKANQTSRIDFVQSKVQLETVRLARDDAENRYKAAWEQLATVAGIPPMGPVPLVGNLTDDIPEMELESRWQELLTGSPQLKSNECDLGHAWATYNEARAAAIPNVTVQVLGEYDRVTQASTFSTLVALPLPIYNQNQGNIDKSSADIIAAQAEIRRVQLVLRDQLADSFRRYQTDLRQTERLKAEILPSAKLNMQLTEEAYVAGEQPISAVLKARQDYFHSQTAYVEALTDLHKVVTEIQGLQLTGGLNPAAIGSAIQNQPGGGAQRQRALLNELQDRASKQLLPAAQISQ